MKVKIIYLICLIISFSCKNAGELQSSKEYDDKTEFIKVDERYDDEGTVEDGNVEEGLDDDGTDVTKNCLDNDGTDTIITENVDWVDNPELDWAVQIRLKPQADESYVATEDPEIMALVSKHEVIFWQIYASKVIQVNPIYLVLYGIKGKNSMSNESRENCIEDFLATGKFEDEVVKISIREPTWSVRFRLKPQTDGSYVTSYIATEDPEIMALVSKHDVMFRQTYPGSRSTPALLSYYTLTGKCSKSNESRENCIEDFLATGKFEDEVYEYEIVYAL